MSEAYWSLSSYNSNSTDESNEIYFSDTGYGSSEEDENNPEVVSIENEGSGGQLQRNLAKLRQLGDLTLKKMNARRQKLLVVRLLAAKSLLATEVQLKVIQENLLNLVNPSPSLPDIFKIGQVSISQIEFEYKNILQLKCLRHFLTAAAASLEQDEKGKKGPSERRTHGNNLEVMRGCGRVAERSYETCYRLQATWKYYCPLFTVTTAYSTANEPLPHYQEKWPAYPLLLTKDNFNPFLMKKNIIVTESSQTVMEERRKNATFCG
ncbi:hypothetical protein GEV33_007742 [Tenebrio molitor]|uniref:Uncharacterized protein n=1 Tax=Tenebrio molitor TaxID=7067 RepID=A0A8J6LAS8_TENMO|nr:hypothetical protein GEV33_007742 [Tenebrio molitor]